MTKFLLKEAQPSSLLPYRPSINPNTIKYENGNIFGTDSSTGKTFVVSVSDIKWSPLSRTLTPGAAKWKSRNLGEYENDNPIF